jgi:Icc-related predicted phosphoesterase
VRINALDAAPLHQLRFLNAARGGGVEHRRLGIARGRAIGLPAEVAALVLTGDLQGVVRAPDGTTKLLGIAVAAALAELAAAGAIPPLARTGALLAGDLYSVPGATRRGGHGDVTEVWHAFADRCAWVAGVAGNHDDLGGEPGAAALRARGNAHVLDGEIVARGGLRIGGVGLVAGDPAKPGRRREEDQLALVDLVIEAGVDVLVLHEGPAGGADQPGRAELGLRVERGRVPLTVCGHVHWPEPLAACGPGQLVNVDGRVLVLVR